MTWTVRPLLVLLGITLMGASGDGPFSLYLTQAVGHAVNVNPFVGGLCLAFSISVCIGRLR